MSQPVVIRAKRFRTMRNLLPGKIIKGDRIVSIIFNRTVKNKWTQRNVKKFIKDYKIKEFISNGSKIANGFDITKENRKITSIIYPIRDKKLYKKFKTKKNNKKDISVIIGYN